MTISLTADRVPVAIRALSFPGGERQVRLLDLNPDAEWLTFKAHLWSPADWFDLLLAQDAARRICPGAICELIVPYLPYARQDQVCHPGGAFSLAVVARLLRGFDPITTWDVHNPVVAMDLIPNLINVSADDLVPSLIASRIHDLANLVVIAPDDGAVGRASGVADALGVPLMRVDKVRDPATGELSGACLLDPPPSGRAALVVDDICDDDRTFVNLGRVLKEAGVGPRYLYVTHGIFSAGFTDLASFYDHLFVANLASFRDISGLDRLITLKKDAAPFS